ncbi:MAG: transglutaminase family protein [Anaerolineales bacterium]|nr:transglutaminase family protein [Anaerolineales bacterium]
MNYKIKHVTKFQYTSPVMESVTEVRKHPRNTEYQYCTHFDLTIKPAAKHFHYEDHLGNYVYHFSQPGIHQSLTVTATSEVHVQSRPTPPLALPEDAWQAIDALSAAGDEWEMLKPSEFTSPTQRLSELATELDVRRRTDPLSMVYYLNSALHRVIAYDSRSTRVDSPIDDALLHRRGVCQDYSHIMLALIRNYLQMPARYVSGYLYHRGDDRSADGATHAWVEVWFPELGWIGFDPTNNIVAGERHVDVAIGCDYHDVPPTRGVYKGNAGSDLAVTVRVRSGNEIDHEMGEDLVATPVYRSTEHALQARYAQALQAMQIQQQQQQQQ